jgi:hypothetical protein
MLGRRKKEEGRGKREEGRRKYSRLLREHPDFANRVC